MVEARVGYTATLLHDGTVLVAGGGGADDAAARSAELYDPSTGRWAATRSMAEGRSDHTATLLPDGKVLVVGGGGEVQLAEGPAYGATAERYDPANRRWTPTASMARARAAHTATLLRDGKVLVVGGSIGDEATARSAELYDPKSGRWTPTGSLAEPRSGHAAIRLADGKVLVVGGYGLGSTPSPLTSAELYDPGRGRWTAAGRLTVARFNGHTATLLPDGRVLVTGGFGPGVVGDVLASAELYDPGSRSWTATAKMIGRRGSHTATLLPDGRVLVAGGVAGSGPLASVELFDPRSGRWIAAASMVKARVGPTATLLPDGRVLVAGGDSSSGDGMRSAELYDPRGH
jgi:N-acetylneuraminic acid mutarotase